MRAAPTRIPARLRTGTGSSTPMRTGTSRRSATSDPVHVSSFDTAQGVVAKRSVRSRAAGNRPENGAPPISRSGIQSNRRTPLAAVSCPGRGCRDFSDAHALLP